MKFSRRVGGVRVFVTCTQVRKLWLGGHEFPTKMKIQGGKGPIVDCPWGEEGVQKSVCIKTYLPPPPAKKKLIIIITYENCTPAPAPSKPSPFFHPWALIS